VRPLEQGLSGGEAMFFGDACLTRRPRAFNRELSAISKEAREYLSAARRPFLIRQPSHNTLVLLADLR
jgi:hypothetical protein